MGQAARLCLNPRMLIYQTPPLARPRRPVGPTVGSSARVRSVLPTVGCRTTAMRRQIQIQHHEEHHRCHHRHNWMPAQLACQHKPALTASSGRSAATPAYAARQGRQGVRALLNSTCTFTSLREPRSGQILVRTHQTARICGCSPLYFLRLQACGTYRMYQSALMDKERAKARRVWTVKQLSCYLCVIV